MYVLNRKEKFMAKKLNKSRIRDSRMIIIVAFIVAALTKALIDFEAPLHEIIDYIGYILLAVCAMGRMYSTAFLGGHKNETLITYGAFSITRNPLYFFSLLGMTGVGLISGHVVVMIAMPVLFLLMYHFLIKREEEFLGEKFGQAYADYCQSTPRLFPNFAKYNAPETVEMTPKYLNKAFFDAIWWFAAFPLFEMTEYVIGKGWITPVTMVP